MPQFRVKWTDRLGIPMLQETHDHNQRDGCENYHLSHHNGTTSNGTSVDLYHFYAVVNVKICIAIMLLKL